LTGIVFVVLLVIGFIPVGGDTPDLDASAPKIVSFYHDNQGKEIAAVILVALAALFLALFAVTLRNYLREGDESDFYPMLALVGGVAAVAGLLVAAGTHLALIDGGDKGISPDAMVALNAIDNDNFFAFTVPLAILLFGAAGSTLRTWPHKGVAELPKWMGWAAVVLGVFYFTPVGFVSFGLTGIWIIIASIVMYRQIGSTAAAATPTA
jgi:hypothetical protein